MCPTVNLSPGKRSPPVDGWRVQVQDTLLTRLQLAVDKQEQQRKRSLKIHLQQLQAGSSNAGAASDGSGIARAEAMEKELLAEEEAAEAAKLANRAKKEAKKKVGVFANWS